MTMNEQPASATPVLAGDPLEITYTMTAVQYSKLERLWKAREKLTDLTSIYKGLDLPGAAHLVEVSNVIEGEEDKVWSTVAREVRQTAYRQLGKAAQR